MNPTKNDIPLDVRKSVIVLLNDCLADLLDLQLQAKQAHWNVKGPTFIALHELFDTIAEELEDHVDDVAERVASLGGIAEGTATAVAGRSKLPTYSLSITKGHDHVDALSTALAVAGKAIRAAIEKSAALNDADTADLLTGISRDLDKKLWFVESHLHG